MIRQFRPCASIANWRPFASYVQATQNGSDGGGIDPRIALTAEGKAITAHIPRTFRKPGGRKRAVTQDGAAWAPRSRVANAMVKALPRAFRWRKMLDTGLYATLEELARAKGVAPSYVGRLLRLTLLAPEIVEAVLDGRQPEGMILEDLLGGFPVEWAGQHLLFGCRPVVAVRRESGWQPRSFAAPPLRPSFTIRGQMGGARCDTHWH